MSLRAQRGNREFNKGNLHSPRLLRRSSSISMIYARDL